MSNKLIVIAQKETTRKDQLGVRITKDDLNSTQVEADTITPNLIQETNGSRYSRMDQVKFVEDNLSKISSDMVRLRRPYHFKFFKGCLPKFYLVHS